MKDLDIARIIRVLESCTSAQQLPMAKTYCHRLLDKLVEQDSLKCYSWKSILTYITNFTIKVD